MPTVRGTGSEDLEVLLPLVEAFQAFERIPFDLLLAVPPHRAPAVVRDAGMTGPSGWIGVDAGTLATRWPGVWAVGDVTAIPLSTGGALPKAGVFAHAEGEVVAARVADTLAGRVPTATFDGRGMCYLETGRGLGWLDIPEARPFELPSRFDATTAS